MEINLKTLHAVSMAASKDKTRYYLNGVYCKVKDGKQTLVATDGHMMAIYETETGQGDHDGIIISSDAIKTLFKAMPKKLNFVIEVKDGQVSMGNYITLPNVLIEGTFPDYERVIHTGEPEAITDIGFNPELVKRAGDIIKAITDSKYGFLRMQFYGQEEAAIFTTKDDSNLRIIVMPTRK